MEVEGYEKYEDFFREYSAIFHNGKIISALPYMIEAVTDALAERERRKREKPWLFTFSSDGWTRAFMFAKQGRLEEAKYIISHEYYSDGYCPEDVLKKLASLADGL